MIQLIFRKVVHNLGFQSANLTAGTSRLADVRSIPVMQPSVCITTFLIHICPELKTLIRML